MSVSYLRSILTPFDVLVLADGKIELFRNGAFLVDKKQEHLSQVSTLLVTVRLFMTMLKDTSYIALASNAVRTFGYRGCLQRQDMNWKESEFKDQA